MIRAQANQVLMSASQRLAAVCDARAILQAGKLTRLVRGIFLVRGALVCTDAQCLLGTISSPYTRLSISIDCVQAALYADAGSEHTEIVSGHEQHMSILAGAALP